MMKEIQIQVLKRPSLMVAQRASKGKQELSFLSRLDVSNAVWARYLLKLGTQCAPSEKPLDFLSIAFSMPIQSLGKRLLGRRRKLIKIPQWI
jgi:hypothetical protein